ncbi:hypothetical protein B484DRAFT_4220 [Ochromonadaceae sp. CCMP2298]|nr:hypothetical protein B484DRAFT_4220 [Ochromonadaceae sp. CCMP2298]
MLGAYHAAREVAVPGSALTRYRGGGKVVSSHLRIDRSSDARTLTPATPPKRLHSFSHVGEYLAPVPSAHPDRIGWLDTSGVYSRNFSVVATLTDASAGRYNRKSKERTEHHVYHLLYPFLAGNCPNWPKSTPIAAKPPKMLRQWTALPCVGICASMCGYASRGLFAIW